MILNPNPRSQLSIWPAIWGKTKTSAQWYDPAHGTFSATPNALPQGRDFPTATRLHDGRVLITGGVVATDRNYPGFYVPTASAEVFDPVVGTFTATGTLGDLKYGHTATLLPGSKVLIAGGTTSNNPLVGVLAKAELYDAALGTFNPAGTMVVGSWGPTATLLADGTVLLTGGYSKQAEYLADGQVFDPSIGVWRATHPMSVARSNHTATLLENGTVLVTGGKRENFMQVTIYSSAEIFDPHL